MVARVRLLTLATSASSTPPTVVHTQPQRTPNMDHQHLPRLDALSFSGRVEDWPEFRRDWLARYGNLREDVQIQYLKPALPQKDQAKVATVTSMADCWTRLEKTYGDRTLNIVTVKNNLRSCQPKGGQRWEKVSDLPEQIEKAVMQLRVLNAEASLAEDFELVSALVSKLAVDYQEDWDKYCISSSDQSLSIWTRFWSWLDEVNNRAVASKLRNMAAGSSTKPEPSLCPKCKSKHKPGQGCFKSRNELGKSLPLVHGHLTTAKVMAKEQLKEYQQETKTKAGNGQHSITDYTAVLASTQ